MEKAIAAVATGNAAAGIGVIRISGEDAIEIADKVFKPQDGSSLTALSGYRAKFGNIVCDGKVTDNAVALVFRAPKSYTGEDVVELSVHGGVFIVEKTLSAVLDAGAVAAGPGEFTKRAFLNGKIDLTQAESVADLISAQGETAARASFNMLQGALSDKINSVLERLMDCSAELAAWVDYPDEEFPDLDDDALKQTLLNCGDELRAMLKDYDKGRTMIQGVRTVIAGKPNVGKSTLMNLLAGEEKSIVTSVRGTTRDIIDQTVRLGDLVLHLSDTAGIRRTDDIVEAIGVERACKRIETADLLLPVFDSSRALGFDDRNLIDRCRGKNAVAIINKIDLKKKLNYDEITAVFKHCVFISARDTDNTDELEAAIREVLGITGFDSSSVILANQRQKACCKKAMDNIFDAISCLILGVTRDAINVLIDDAINELLSLTGRKATEEVVNNIFSKFCVGK